MKKKFIHHWAKALIQNKELGRTSEKNPTATAPFAIYPVGTIFNKDVLKEYKCKVIDVKITEIKK